MNKNIELLSSIIDNINKENYKCEFINGGYSYSSEITDIFAILEDEFFKKIFDDNYRTYSKSGKDLNNTEDISSFNLIECVIYLNWLWHVDGSGLATGIVNLKIKSGRYLKLLLRFEELISQLD